MHHDSAYYNEVDPKAVAALHELIRAGIIAPGVVDERSIEDVKPSELLGYTQCHFFAGAGIWSYAARRAGWPDSRPLWTGSCPCQPFSAAGKGCGFTDERHLWPAFFHLIQHGKPRDVPVLGEQVASKDGLTWLDLVQADLEGAGHSCWPYDICAAGFGAPIIRQRLFWVAVSSRVGLEAGSTSSSGCEGGTALPEHRSCVERMARTESGGFRPRLRDSQPSRIGRDITSDSVGASGVVRSFQSRLEGHSGDGDGSDQPRWVEAEPDGSTAAAGAVDGMASPQSNRWKRRQDDRNGGRGECSSRPESAPSGMAGSNGGIASDGELQRGGEQRLVAEDSGAGDRREGARPTNGFWRNADWLYCRDDKWRPVEPGAFVLAYGYPQRTGLLRLAGNAINAEVATAFIEEVITSLEGIA